MLANYSTEPQIAQISACPQSCAKHGKTSTGKRGNTAHIVREISKLLQVWLNDRRVLTRVLTLESVSPTLAPVDSAKRCRRQYGEVSEWLKEHAWKVCIRESVSRVRTPLSPPYSKRKPELMFRLFCYMPHRTERGENPRLGSTKRIAFWTAAGCP